MNFWNFSEVKTILFNNVTTKQTIFKNTFWISLSEGIGKILRAFLIIYIARVLGAAEYGKFTFALAFVSLFVAFFDFGLSNILTREFSKDKTKEKEFPAVLSLKILLGLISIILILLTSFFITSEPEIRKIIWILAFFTFISQLPEIFYSFLRARQKMEYESWANIFNVLLVVGCGFFVLFNFPSVKNISYSYLLASLAALIPFLLFFHFKILSLRFSFKTDVWKKFLAMSWPLALVSILGMFYSYIDSVMMGRWNLIIETGWYNAALKIINVILVPQAIIALVFYPTISRFAEKSKEMLQKVWDYQLRILIFLAIPIVVGGITLSFKIIDFVYDLTFKPSVLTLQILLIMSGIAFFCGPFSQILIAFNQQKKVFWAAFVGGIINIILNFILIPKYSLYGAAVATVITYSLILFIYFLFVRRFTSIQPFNFKIFTVFFKVIFASILMYFVISAPPIYNFHVLYIVFIGAVIYLLSFLILEIINKKLNRIFIND